MGCGCNKGRTGTVQEPRTVQRPITAAEVRARMPRKPERRPQSINAPRRAQ
jgi:hypothetical protein